MRSGGTVLVTATTVTSAGSRPARRAARAIRSCTAAQRSATEASIEGLNP
jgi:hypothetical protein